MNVKITIKDCDCAPSVNNVRQISEVQHKKKTMLYAPPEKDKITKQTIKQKIPPNSKKQSLDTNSKQYRDSQKEMLDALNANGQNKATIDMVQNSNNILQRQSEILEQNQRTLHNMVSKNKNNQQLNNKSIEESINRKLDQIKNQMDELKKMKIQFIKEKQQFDKAIAQTKNNVRRDPQIPSHINQMHTNIKNQIQASHNNIEGLQNMEAIKNLQSFNIEGYNQALNSLKRQIAQYQKQSQHIERQLKIRTAKLQKLQMPPKFQEQLYRPYQQHLNNRVKNIDLHAIRQKIYDKIGTFDYGKFEYDVGVITSEIKSELSNFPIICKEHRIIVPDIRIDQKQLKNMEIKIPSVLEQYKARRGIKFEDPSKENKASTSNLQRQTIISKTSKTNEIQQRLKQTNMSKRPNNLQQIRSNPVDLAHQVKLTKQYEKKPTILQNEDKRQKRQLQERAKKPAKQQKKQDDDFQKYLQNRAREQLQHLYKQKKQRLQRMQNQLHQEVTNPVYINLDIDKQKLRPQYVQVKQQDRKKQPKIDDEDNYEEQFERESEQNSNKQIIIQKQDKKNQAAHIKQVGRQILKQKLKNLIGQKNKIIRNHIPPQQSYAVRPQSAQNGERQIQNIAEGFINMINNTLTQVNTNLAKSIQKKIELSNEKRSGSLERKQTKKMTIPQLQAFRPPPVFNLNLAQQPMGVPYIVQPPIYQPPQPQKKIVVENYDQYKIKNDDDYRDYQISSEDDDDI